MTRKSYYVVTIHNKENLIESVLNGIKKSHLIGTPTIICVLDGCTDNTESIVKNFKEGSEFKDSFHLLYQNDVHEILSLNTALNFIKTNCNPNPDDLIFMLQDDVVLDEVGIDDKMGALLDSTNHIGYISMRIGAEVDVLDGKIIEMDLLESEFGHWNQMNMNFQKNLKHNTYIPCEVVIRSPACMEWKRFEEAGFFDENLAPYGFDCHDMSIRMNKLGYTNIVVAYKFISDVKWGSMRSAEPSEYTKQFDFIHKRNLAYLATKHQDYFAKKRFHNYFQQFSKNIYSQNGEDGILERLLALLPDSNKISIEFGGGDGKTNSNTLNLMEKYDFTGYFIEADSEHFKSLKSVADANPKMIAINAMVDYKDNENSLTNLLKNAGLTEKSPDIMSIDIDGLDYKVWESLIEFTPKIVIIEINSSLHPRMFMDKYLLSDESLIAQGSNFLTMVRLGERKGYSFVIWTGNCIFIRNDYAKYLADSMV